MCTPGNRTAAHLCLLKLASLTALAAVRVVGNAWEPVNKRACITACPCLGVRSDRGMPPTPTPDRLLPLLPPPSQAVQEIAADVDKVWRFRASTAADRLAALQPPPNLLTVAVVEAVGAAAGGGIRPALWLRFPPRLKFFMHIMQNGASWYPP